MGLGMRKGALEWIELFECLAGFIYGYEISDLSYLNENLQLLLPRASTNI